MDPKEKFLKDLFDELRPVMNDPTLTYEEFCKEKGKDREDLLKVADGMLKKGWSNGSNNNQ